MVIFFSFHLLHHPLLVLTTYTKYFTPSLSYGIYEIFIDIKTVIKLGAILSNNGREYYRWVDSFLNEIENAVSRVAFFRRINWDSNLASLRCLSNTQKANKEKSVLSSNTARKSLKNLETTLQQAPPEKC